MPKTPQRGPSEQQVLQWLGLLYQGDRVALGRLLTLVEGQSSLAPLIYAQVADRLGGAQVVGFTGPPGAGKSTLVSAYAGALRKRGATVGILAVDPSSPYSGGAILGDRLRMREHAEDPGVFVRSVASQGYLGGLSVTAFRAIDLMDAAGREVILVETVGTGQSEVDIVHLADTNVVVTVPGYGDEIQAIKAGILEIADITVVNKADQSEALAETTAHQLQSRVGGGSGRSPRVLQVSALQGTGIEALVDAVTAHASDSGRRPGAQSRARQALAGATIQRIRGLLMQGDSPQLDAISRDFISGKTGVDDAIQQVIAELQRGASVESPPG